MKEYCSNCYRLTEGIDHFDCDNEGRVIEREISCTVCHRVRVVEHYAKPIPRFFSVWLLQSECISPSVGELAKKAGLRRHYTGNCVTCGKEYTYNFDDDRQRNTEPLCFCSPECYELYKERRREAEEIFTIGYLNRILIGEQD